MINMIKFTGSLVNQLIRINGFFFYKTKKRNIKINNRSLRKRSISWFIYNKGHIHLCIVDEWIKIGRELVDCSSPAKLFFLFMSNFNVSSVIVKRDRGFIFIQQRFRRWQKKKFEETNEINSWVLVIHQVYYPVGHCLGQLIGFNSSLDSSDIYVSQFREIWDYPYPYEPWK